MLPNNATLLSVESTAELLSQSRAFNQANVPPIAPGQHYFIKADSTVGLEAGSLVNIAEFVNSATELNAAKARTTTVPIYDITTGAKHEYVEGAWAISATASLWTDYSNGRILYNVVTGSSYYIDYIGSVLKL